MNQHYFVEARRAVATGKLSAFCDQCEILADLADRVSATVEWMKDGPEDATVISRLEPVEVGIDEDGEPITSCVVVPADEAAKASAMKWPKSLVLYNRALREALDAFGQDSLLFIDGPSIRAVNREYVRAEFKRVYPVDGDSDAKKGEALKKAFKRAEQDALTRNLIACRENDGAMLVWPVSS